MLNFRGKPLIAGTALPVVTISVAHELNGGKKVALATIGLAALVVPIMIGVLNAPVIRAQISPENLRKFEVASIKPRDIQKFDFAADSQRFHLQRARLR
jgi:hypothetical protein